MDSGSVCADLWHIVCHSLSDLTENIDFLQKHVRSVRPNGDLDSTYVHVGEFQTGLHSHELSECADEHLMVVLCGHAASDDNLCAGRVWIRTNQVQRQWFVVCCCNLHHIGAFTDDHDPALSKFQKL